MRCSHPKKSREVFVRPAEPWRAWGGCAKEYEEVEICARCGTTLRRRTLRPSWAKGQKEGEACRM